jgi:hypothetical protein
MVRAGVVAMEAFQHLKRSTEFLKSRAGNAFLSEVAAECGSSRVGFHVRSGDHFTSTQ